MFTWAWLSCLAATLERRVWMPLIATKVLYPNMYVVLAGEPGTGKTVCGDIAVEILEHYNRTIGRENPIKFGHKKVTPASLITSLARATKTVKGMPGLGELTHSSIFQYSYEFGVFIEDIGGGSLATDMLAYYDCPNIFDKETIGRGIEIIKNPCVNLLACTTPSFLSSYIPKEASGQGLTSRMLFAAEFDKIEKDAKPAEADLNKREQLVHEVHRLRRLSGPMVNNPDADKAWEEMFYEIDEELQSAVGGSFRRNFYARKLDYIRKLAMILCASRDSRRIILVEDYVRARELIEEAEPHMEKSFGMKDFRRVEDACARILQAVPYEPDYIAQSGLMNNIYTQGGLGGSMRDFDEMLKFLREARLIKMVKNGNGEPNYTRLRG